jgi:MFS family permease
MVIGSVLGLVSLVAYALAPSVAWLLVAAAFVGVANSAVDIGLPAVMSEETPIDERPAVMAGWNSLTGARGVAAPFIASGLVAAGIVDVTGALLLCAATTAIGTILYLRIGISGSSQKPTPI